VHEPLGTNEQRVGLPTEQRQDVDAKLGLGDEVEAL
jgi:hypothetical protein